MAVELRQVSDKRTLKDFLNVVDVIYADDPHWVRPLDMDVRGRLDKKENPFYEHGDADAWVAYKDGVPVGRISASIDNSHLERYEDGAGYFGFFDTIDDQEVADSLLLEAEKWCKAKGSTVCRGPFSLCINEELGCLIEGFDAPPTIMMGHHRRYQGDLIANGGYGKLKDFLAWRYDFTKFHPRALRGHQQIAELPEVTSRVVNMKDFDQEVRLIMDIYNDAWSDNWGFVPLTNAELDKMAKDLKMIMVPEITRIAYIDGEPAGVALGVPNINEVVKSMGGSLNPVSLVKMLWWLKVSKPKSGRLIILGIRKKFRKVRRYAGLSAFLYVEMHKAGAKLGMTSAELGWTLEDNSAVNVGIKLMGGKIHKKYRVYEKALD
jgi:hypothetical protein